MINTRYELLPICLYFSFYNCKSQWVQSTIRIHSWDNKQTTFIFFIQMYTINAKKWPIILETFDGGPKAQNTQWNRTIPYAWLNNALRYPDCYFHYIQILRESHITIFISEHFRQCFYSSISRLVVCYINVIFSFNALYNITKSYIKLFPHHK